MKRRDKFQPLDENGEYLTGPALYEVVREISGDTLLLAFSRGKDSISMWLELREHFNIIPYYCYMVPGGLSYERESLDYYEDYFGVHIARFHHAIFWKNINDFVFQPPLRVSAIRALGIPNYDYKDFIAPLVEQHGLDNPYVAFGYRMNDSPRRRLLMMREGPMGYKDYRYFWAIWDWDIDRVADKLREANIALPRDYMLWGRTNTTIDYQYMTAIRDNLPDDWEEMKFWYPLLDAEIFRHEVVGK